ncbi:MAG TPA: DUF4126 family protein [Pyrinomonadaceae bacterium]|nr:DUF4126 family protein [Pyrinomonadaceae bacterium]
MILLLAFLIGMLAGLRSMTAPAATAWAARLGWLRLERPLSYIGSLPAVVLLTLFAVGELVADKLPRTPARTSPPGLVARIVTGGLSGACIASSGGAGALTGALLGAFGGVVGCFGGFQARTRLVKALGVRDIYVALVEDFVAVAGCLFILSRV